MIGCSVRGAAHKRKGAPNQDAVAWSRHAMAVSDGHGSKSCPRSHVGSRLAVSVAVALLEEFATEHAESDFPDAALWDELPRELVDRWVSAVFRHQRGSPVEGDAMLPYGATLIAAVVTDRWAGWLQVGDGDVLLVDDGGAVTRPVPGDARLLGNATTSLSGNDAWRDFRVHARAGGLPALSMLCTDGYSNSFATESGYLRLGSDFQRMIASKGLDTVAENLPRWLNETSMLGSGDDVTVGLAARR